MALRNTHVAFSQTKCILDMCPSTEQLFKETVSNCQLDKITF